MKKKILLIDDEELVIKSVYRLLTKEGYEVISCRSGEEALEKVKDGPVDLIICDIRMPNLTGIDTVKKIREFQTETGRKVVPEILITGYADEIANKEAETLMVADYISKPFDLRDFVACIRRNIEK